MDDKPLVLLVVEGDLIRRAYETVLAGKYRILFAGTEEEAWELSMGAV